MNLSFSNKFYRRFRKKGETLIETVKRVDQEVISSNFDWICERDTLSSGMIINTERNSELCMPHKKSLSCL